MAQRCNPNLFEVLICQIRQDDKANVILGKTPRVSRETELFNQSATCCIAAAPRVSAAWYALKTARPSRRRLTILKLLFSPVGTLWEPQRCNAQENTSNLRRGAFRKLGQQPIPASNHFGPKWLRSGNGSLTRGRGARVNTPMSDAMRPTRAIRGFPAISQPAAPAHQASRRGRMAPRKCASPLLEHLPLRRTHKGQTLASLQSSTARSCG
jgi:hypothetical protein